MSSNEPSTPLGPPASRRRLSPDSEPSPWRSRGYLPHFERPGLVQALTFRLHDSVPAHVIESWKSELSRSTAQLEVETKLRKQLTRYEDQGHGACWLGEEAIAALVERALLEFDEARYRIIAWCIMPNHVHVLIEALGEWTLDRVVHAWKSFTAHEANRVLGRSGQFWAREYHHRFVRDDDHLKRAIRYIENNPVAAGLAPVAEAWPWSSASYGR